MADTEGEHIDHIVEQGLLLDDDLRTETIVVLFYHPVDRTPNSIYVREGELVYNDKKSAP